MHKNSFGNRLLDAFQGVSQTEIAKLLKLSNSAITNYVEGRIPPAETLIKIASLTGYSIHWLITGEGPEKALQNSQEDSKSQTIMLVNEKGGSAKSTSAVFLSIDFARRGYRTLLVDSSSGDCAYCLFAPLLSKLLWKYISPTQKNNKRLPQKRMFFKTDVPGLNLCTSNERVLLMLTEQGLNSIQSKPEFIQRDYDFIIVDTDSAINTFNTLNPFTASLITSAQVLMPVYAHPLSLSSVKRTVENLRSAMQSATDITFIGAFLTVFYPDRDTSQLMITGLEKLLPRKVLNTRINESDEVAGLASYSPLKLMRHDSPGAAEYSPLATEVLKLLGRTAERR